MKNPYDIRPIIIYLDDSPVSTTATIKGELISFSDWSDELSFYYRGSLAHKIYGYWPFTVHRKKEKNPSTLAWTLIGHYKQTFDLYNFCVTEIFKELCPFCTYNFTRWSFWKEGCCHCSIVILKKIILFNFKYHHCLFL